MKKLACLTLALALSASLSLPALAAVNLNQAFPVTNHNPDFADVLERDWFYTAVDTCAKVGLMTGTGTNPAGTPVFSPKQTLTVGEVAVIAVRLDAGINGTEVPAASGTPWYQSYVDYLTAKGISVPDGSKVATRQEFVTLLAAVVPDELLQPINHIEALPDTSDPDVLAFYNAGILTGVDDWGTFDGSKSLNRDETAAMVARVVREDQRQSFSPADPRLLQAAGMDADDVLFVTTTGTVTAGQFLPQVAKRIQFLEGQYSGFNWNNMYGDQTYREYVLDGAYQALGVTERAGTDLYKTFDVQVWYSKLLDLGVRY